MAGDGFLSISLPASLFYLQWGALAAEGNTHMMERWTAALCSLRIPVWCNCKTETSYLITQVWAAGWQQKLTPATPNLDAWRLILHNSYCSHQSRDCLLLVWVGAKSSSSSSAGVEEKAIKRPFTSARGAKEHCSLQINATLAKKC